ncbi:hypothetical protein EMGR_000355, partial [Emarellia grisea]
LPMTIIWLKSSPNALANLYASPAGETWADPDSAFAPRPQVIAATCAPSRARASASTDNEPRPMGIRGVGTGTPGSSTVFATEAAFVTATAFWSVGADALDIVQLPSQHRNPECLRRSDRSFCARPFGRAEKGS